MEAPTLLEITNEFPPALGGIENYIYSLVSRWPGRVVVLTKQVASSESFDRSLPFPVVRHNASPLLPTRSLSRLAEVLAREHTAGFIHFSGPFPLPLLGPHLSKRLGIPYAVSVHGGEFVLNSTLPVVRTFVRHGLRSAGSILCESKFVLGRVKRFLGESAPVSYVPAGVDLERFTARVEPAFRSPHGGPLILSVGRLVARKGPATLIRALPAVAAKHPNSHALIVGGGPDRSRLEKLASSHGVSDRVTFTGPRPWDEIPRYYAAADVFAFPTRARFGGLETEGLPLVCLEAAAAGLPQVSGDAGGVRDAVRDGETGYLVDGRDPEATARALTRLLDDPEAARKMGESARKLVASEFTWERCSARFVEAVEKATRRQI